MQAVARMLALAGATLLLAGCLQNLFYQPDRVLYDTPARAGRTQYADTLVEFFDAALAKR